jgi:hypothetical protein
MLMLYVVMEVKDASQHPASSNCSAAVSRFDQCIGRQSPSVDSADGA